MKPLEKFLSEQSEITIQTLASYIQQCIQEQWQPVLQKGQEELLRLYDKAGEGAAYGTYAHRLFQPVQEQLIQTGFSSSPPFQARCLLHGSGDHQRSGSVGCGAW